MIFQQNLKKTKKVTQAQEIKVDVHISVLKPLHASCVTKFYDKMQIETDIILSGWKQSGIANTVSSKNEKKNPFKVQFYFEKL